MQLFIRALFIITQSYEQSRRVDSLWYLCDVMKGMSHW